MDQFEDPLEGITTEIIRRVMLLFKEADFNLANYITERHKRNSGGVFFGSNRLSDRVDKVIELQTQHYVSCWFNQKRESMAMWNLYSNMDGVAIKIPFDNLNKNLLPEIDIKKTEYYCGKVNYQDFKDEDQYSENALRKTKKIALRKDESYSHEKEVRYVFKLTDSRKDSVQLTSIPSQKLDLKSLGIKVVCHPRMPFWKKENIKRMLSDAKLTKCYQISEIQLR